jgi:transcription antitermination protein NusB
MGIRREARELALTYLYQLDLGVEDLQTILETLEKDRRGSLKVRRFACELVRGVWSNRQAVDERIAAHLQNWKLERLTRTDRGLLRMAVFEMKFQTDVPGKVAINEAVEIGKKFGGEESGRFLNGVLDAVYHAS